MNNIKNLRNKFGLTVRELAMKSKVAVGYLSDLENNNKKNPSKKVMTNISNVLLQTVQKVFFSDDEKVDKEVCYLDYKINKN